MEGRNVEKTMEAVELLLEKLRDDLHAALAVAGGNQLDPDVQAASVAFDEAMNEYMRLLQEKHLAQ